MVDPVDLGLVEMLRQNAVQRARRGQIAAKRLFDHDPAVVIGDAMPVQPLCQLAKKAGRDREIESVDAVMINQAGQSLPATLAHGVDGDIAQALQKRVELLGALRIGSAEFDDRLADHVAKAVIVHFRAGRADDLRAARHLPGQEPPEQPRQDLAAGQIAGAAENDQIERVYRNDARYHGLLLHLWRC